MGQLEQTAEFPLTWDEYIGQDAAKEALRTAAKSAAVRGDVMRHVLITSSIPGQGKTSLMRLVAQELGIEPHMISGRLKLNQARMMFADLITGQPVMWDEFHGACKTKGDIDWFLDYGEGNKLPDFMGAQDVPQVTFLAATTDKGVIPEAVLTRFKVIELEPYTDYQAMMIAGTMSDKVMLRAGLPNVNDDTAAAIAAAASNAPRLMRQILESLRDLAVIDEIKPGDDGTYPMERALRLTGVTADGLNLESQRYLMLMVKELHGEPAGAAYFKERMGLVGKGLTFIEQNLLNKGLIVKSKQGRILTGAGIRRAKDLMAAADAA